MSGPRKRVREDPKVRRSQIVDEAIRIIGEYGYYGFTVQALAERCQLSNAGLLHYFGNKDDLLLALLDEPDATRVMKASICSRPSAVGEK